jgi:hypothetical protein
VTATSLSLTHVTFYPPSVVKCRLQISSGNKTTNTVFRELMSDTNIYGVNNIYKGYGVTLSTGLPTQFIYIYAPLIKVKIIMQVMFKYFPLEEHTKKSIAEQIGAMGNATDLGPKPL